MSQITVEPIGYIKTPFKQKFAIPRQPNLACAEGTVFLAPRFKDANVFMGLEQFSHIWLLFHFHGTADQGWKSTVKAPRLGGNKPLGVFASRSTFRPNNIGMSVVRRGDWAFSKGILTLKVYGADLLDDTPILDIKPYLPYADGPADALCLTGRSGNFDKPDNKPVRFSVRALCEVKSAEQLQPGLKQLIVEVLGQDPRPAYRKEQKEDDKVYRVQLYEFDIAWQVKDNEIVVESISSVAST